MAKYRRGRINDEVKKSMASILRKVKDPRVSEAFISVTGAEVTPDLKFAKIYYSAMNAATPEAKKEVRLGLKSSAGFIRRALSAELNLRITPELSFVEDSSIQYGAHISELLHGLTYADASDASKAEQPSDADAPAADTSAGEDGDDNA